jgi:PAS domain S-box-containing protein
MKDEDKTREQLINELAELRLRMAELEAIETERQGTEDALRESEARYKALFDRSLYYIYVHDFEGRFVDANEAALNLLGYRREELPSLSLSSLVGEAQLPRAFGTLGEIKQTGYQKHLTEYKLKRKDGNYLWVETDGSLIYRQGEPCAILGVARDITERKRVEEERERLILELREALAQVKTLSGLLPICASCKRIRDDEGYWNQIETYIQKHSEAEFSHGICPECAKKLYPGLFKDDE